MVRAANTGVSALIDAKGRVLAALPLNEAGFLDVTLPAPSTATLYSKTGDWPVALILVLCFLGLLLGLLAKRRRNGN
jgi:apolipoprotein N-acyltransferase